MKKIIIICIAALASIQAYAQFDLTSEGQKMVRQAFDDALVLVRQSYVVLDADNKKYGLGDADYFGRTLGVGVRTDCGLMMLGDVAQPWRNDSKFDKYKENYRPEISLTECRSVKDSAFKAMEKKIDKFMMVSDSAIAYAQSVKSEESLGAVLPEEGKVNGWLVLLTSKEPIDDDNDSPLSIDVYKQTITFEKQQKRYPIESTPAMNVKNIIGGIYVVPSYKMGKIIFRYAGLLEKTKDGWRLLLTSKNALECEASGASAKDKKKSESDKEEQLKPLEKKATGAEPKGDDSKACKKLKPKKQDDSQKDDPPVKPVNEEQLNKID